MFQRATKKNAKLRLFLAGPAGAGKTKTSLRIAAGLGGTVALIDTERGSASKYAHQFTFDVAELTDTTIDGYKKAVTAARGYDILIIDSLSHAWQSLLEMVDHLAATRFKGNSWSAWSEATPKQRELVDAILGFPGHVIATSRVSTEWTQEQDKQTGKVKPVKLGMKPEQGKGIEYEFDVLATLTTDHVMTVEKDRTELVQGQIIDKPGEELGKQWAAWLASDVTPAAAGDLVDTAPVVDPLKPEREELLALIEEHKINDVQISTWERYFKTSLVTLSEKQLKSLIKKIKETYVTEPV